MARPPFPADKIGCIRTLERLRWRNGPVCPYCKTIGSTAIPKEGRHRCKSCNTTFSVLVGTIFHNTKLNLQKWFAAIRLVMIIGKRPSARKLARDLKISKNTACQVITRINQATATEQSLLLEIGDSHV